MLFRVTVKNVLFIYMTKMETIFIWIIIARHMTATKKKLRIRP